ncbi:MAG TPA: 3-hydroxyanthranilate 3,4-dioxygenase [Gemmataceae bacterium]|nr:3-hydroxyanthranilate 3,4-dioxygenase [Gemmataceae bacterium]
MPLQAPFNLHRWVEENRHLLRPPVGNACLWNGGFLVMVVGGPNQRTDYHVNPAEELFYQLEGDIVLKVMDDGTPRDIPIRQGEIFLLPAKVPHSPRRPANTVGLVVEQPRASAEEHHLRWYCPKCQAVVHDVTFRPEGDIGQQIKAALDQFRADEALRACKACGAVHPV